MKQNKNWDDFAKENSEDLQKVADIARKKMGDSNDISAFMNQNPQALNSLFSMLSSEDMDRLSTMIKDPKIIERIMSSPKAMENLKKIIGK